MGNSKRIIKQGIVITCCLLLVIGTGRAMAGEKEERNDERHVYIEEYDSTVRADIKVGETVRADAGMGGQDVPGIEADDREEVPESEPEDTEAESASDGSGRDSTEAEAGDNGAVDGRSSIGAGEGSEAEYSYTDDTVSDMESTDSTGWDWGMENDSSVSEYSEPGYAEQYVYDSESDSYVDSNEQYGDTEYSEDTDIGWSDGYESAMLEPEIQNTESEESVDGGWVYYTTALITHYDDCEICCGRAGATAASGVYPTPNHTVAAGYSIPFGTEVMINGNVYVVEDRGVDDGVFDVFVTDHETALAMGAYYAEVYIRW